MIANAWELLWVHGWHAWPPVACIYALVNVLDYDVYIGRTIDAYRRKCSHDWRLRRQTHPNLLLRDACPDGIDDRFWRFVVLEEVDNWFEQLDREWWWHRHLPDRINTANDRIVGGCRILNRTIVASKQP